VPFNFSRIYEIMRTWKLFAAILPVAVLAACDDDGVSVQGPPEAQAVVRFVNAAVDTGTVDLRFVDQVENLPTLMGVPFQGHSGGYQRTAPGTRPARVFPSSSDINLTSIRLIDTDVALSADARYTFVYAGRASAGAPAGEGHQLAVISEPFTMPTPPSDQIALQALHTVVGAGNVDVYVVAVDSSAAPTPADWATNNAAVIANVAYLEKGADYVNVPALDSPELYRFIVTAAGTTTPIFSATPNQPGSAAPAGASYGPTPGVRIAGSVLTAVVAPGSTPGTRQSTAANQSPTVFLMVDKTLDP
jgi:hypothetical protein